MNYVKHQNNDLVYGTLNGLVFCQHKWVSLNKPVKEGIARGEIGQFVHTHKTIQNIADFLPISNSDYEALNYADYNRIQ